VNGPYIRKNIDPEFTNFGHHLSCPYIPVNEFWLDLENAPGEDRFFISHMKVEHRLMTQGIDYDDALDLAGAAENEERTRTSLAEEGRSLIDSGRTAILMERIHKELWTEYSRSVQVWIVDGELVRDVLFVDFTEGGHDRVYSFVPKNEIWIDDDVTENERRLILYHELLERRLMGDGIVYRKAHRASSRKELWFRHHPDRLGSELDAEVDRSEELRRSGIPAPVTRTDPATDPSAEFTGP
jgi:hypothetical protein